MFQGKGSETLLIIALILGISVGVYDGAVYFDQKPTPRAFFNYAGALYKANDTEGARLYWEYLTLYHVFYGEDWRSKNPNLTGMQPWVNIHNAEFNLKRTKWQIDFKNQPKGINDGRLPDFCKYPR